MKKKKKKATFIKPEQACTFCSKPNKQVKRLFEGLFNTYICDECVELFHDVGDQRDRIGAGNRRR